MSSPDRRIEMSSALVTDLGGARIVKALDDVRVHLVLPDGASTAVAAAAALFSMTARVFTHVEIHGDSPMPINPWGIATAAEGIRGLTATQGGQGVATRDIVIAFGDSRRRADWYIGGDDWTAVVSRRPARLGPCMLGGLGLQAAAALAFGEVLKSVLHPLGMRCVVGPETMVWNLLDGRTAPAPAMDAPRSLESVSIAGLGCGSVGSSAVGLLVMTPITGRAALVDPDRFDTERNAYRYPALPPGTVADKAEWAAAVLRAAGWTADAFIGTIAAWTESATVAGFDGLALVSVDRVDGRLDAADLLARTTVSVGVSGLSLHAQLSVPDDELACPYCEYVDMTPPMSQLEVYADLTGLPGDRVARLLEGERLTLDDVTDAVQAERISATGAEALIGGRFEDLLRRRYARADVKLGDSGLSASVSAAHVSWLGGTLLAAEVVKRAAGLPLLNRRVEIDLSGIPIGGWRRPARDSTGRCVCANPRRRELARGLHSR